MIMKYLLCNRKTLYNKKKIELLEKSKILKREQQKRKGLLKKLKKKGKDWRRKDKEMKNKK